MIYPTRFTKNASENKSSGVLGTTLGTGAGAIAGGTTTAVLATPIAGAMFYNEVKNKQPDMTSAEFSKLKDAFLRGKKNPPKFFALPGVFNIGSHYNPSTNTVASSPRSYIAAHELGHATGPVGADSSKAVRGIVNAGYRLSKLAPIARALQGYTQAYNKEMGIEPGTGQNVIDALGTASMVGTGIQLTEEGQATLRALKKIREVQGGAGMRRALMRTLGPAYLTYLAGAAGSHAVAPWVAGLLGRRAARKEKKST